MRPADIQIDENTTVAVVGYGVTGRAAARYALAQKCTVLVSEGRASSSICEEDRNFFADNNIAWEAGGHSEDFLGRADVVLLSPGINPGQAPFNNLEEKGKTVCGELAVAAGRIAVPVVAVTGTNGKTTVTSLIGSILRLAGRRAFVGGNIGTPLYEYLMHPEDYEMVVLEVSSFQLERCGAFAPDIGILLNVTPDHLDRHASMEKYLRAKKKLFMNQKPSRQAIVNGDEPICRLGDGETGARVMTFGFGGHCDLCVGEVSLRLNFEGCVEEYLVERKKGLSGFNLMNYGAAVLATRLAGCTPLQIQYGLQKFQVPSHRLEFVTEIEGVPYYNDSKATNTGAVIAALGQFPGDVVLIAGGSDKGEDYRLLKKTVSEKVRKIILLGESAGSIGDALAGHVDISYAGSMEEAVALAGQNCCPGGSVLLSPACASFDMFSGYKERGEVFKSHVLRLKGTAK